MEIVPRKSVMIVLTNELPGREDDFNAWYDHVHMKEVTSVPGFTLARRFSEPIFYKSPEWMSGDCEGLSPPSRYLAIYDIEGDPAAAAEALASASEEWGLSDSYDRSNVIAWIYSERTVTPPS